MKDFAKSIRTKAMNKAIVLKDGNVWVVLYANETKSQEFETEEEAKKFAAKVGNDSLITKDGRVNYPDKEIGEINMLKKELEGLMRMAQSDKSHDYTKQIEALKKEISDKKNKYAIGNSKAGNAKTFYIIAPNGEKVEAIDYDQWHYKCVDTGELVEKRYSKVVGNSKVGNANKIFSGKYLDIYDNGLVVAKEGWAFGESFNENTFGRWIDEQIRSKEKTLQECKQMKREFESNY